MVHTYLKDLYEIFGREWFFTHTFYYKFRPLFDTTYSSYDTYAMDYKQLLTKLFVDGYIINKYPISEEKKNLLKTRWFVIFPQKMEWRISGKAIIELKETCILSDVETTEKDLVDVAKINLLSK